MISQHTVPQTTPEQRQQQSQQAQRVDHDGQDWRGVAERIRNGDPVALTDLFSAFSVRLCAYALRGVHRRDVAEELVQDVFLNIWINRETFHVTDSIILYLFRAVRNRMLNYLRHERLVSQHQVREQLPLQRLQTERKSVDELLVQRELYEAVMDAVNALPERSREIFLLNRESGLTYVQIASMLNISVKTVEYHMGRAFTLLRRQLADWTIV